MLVSGHNLRLLHEAGSRGTSSRRKREQLAQAESQGPLYGFFIPLQHEVGPMPTKAVCCCGQSAVQLKES